MATKIMLCTLILSLSMGCTMPDKKCLTFDNEYARNIYISDDCKKQREVEDNYGWIEYFWKVPLYTVLGVVIVAAALSGGGGGGFSQSTSTQSYHNQYGQPVTVQGGTPNSYIQKYDAYGPGQHMDQYGNNVTLQ